jgi:hypothetical protein
MRDEAEGDAVRGVDNRGHRHAGFGTIALASRRKSVPEMYFEFISGTNCDHDPHCRP